MTTTNDVVNVIKIKKIANRLKADRQMVRRQSLLFREAYLLLVLVKSKCLFIVIKWFLLSKLMIPIIVC